MTVTDQELEEMAERHVRSGSSWLDKSLTLEEMERLFELIKKKESTQK